jgi:hypothetical protein
VAEAIQQAEVLLLFATLGGHHQEWVNKELQESSEKPVLALVEQGILLEFLQPQDTVEFNRSENLADVLQKVTARLTDLRQGLADLRRRRRIENLLTGLVVGGLVLLLLRGLKGEKAEE